MVEKIFKTFCPSFFFNEFSGFSTECGFLQLFQDSMNPVWFTSVSLD